MPVATRNLHSLRDIRTLSGRSDEASLPHRAYMKLACLEMEKARRRTERNSTTERIKSIDARIQEIEIEEAALRQALGGEAAGPRCAAPGNAPPLRGKKRPFKVRY